MELLEVVKVLIIYSESFFIKLYHSVNFLKSFFNKFWNCYFLNRTYIYIYIYIYMLYRGKEEVHSEIELIIY